MADYAIHDTTLTGISNVIRKKEGSAALIDPADYADRINLMGMLQEKTIVFWPFCDFEDGADDVPTKAVKISIPPTLSGVSAVSVVNSGKNLIYPKYSGRTYKGITYTVNSDHTITIQGEATDTSWSATNLSGNPELMQIFPAGTYTLTGGISSNIQFYLGGIYIDDGTAVPNSSDTGSGRTITLTKRAYVYPQIRVSSGTVINTPITLTLQAEIGSTASAYEPYIAPTTYSANLGRTVYGAEVDIVNGTGKETGIKKTVRWGDLGNVTQLADVTRKEIVLSASEEAKYSMASASTDLLNDKNLPYDMTYSGNYEHIYIANSQRIWVYLPNDTDANTEISVSYTLADSLHTDFTFDGQEIPTRLGYNCFISEQGDTSVAYRASGTVYNYPSGEEASF